MNDCDFKTSLSHAMSNGDGEVNDCQLAAHTTIGNDDDLYSASPEEYFVPARILEQMNGENDGCTITERMKNIIVPSANNDAPIDLVSRLYQYEYVPLVATESQYEAIMSPPDPDTLLSIRAGPGSGKTHTLVNRIAYLITTGNIQPNEILVLSMANRSVKSLRSNLSNIIGEELASEIQISTFHSFCGSTLENYGSRYSSEFGSRRLMDDSSWKAFSKFFSRKSIKISGVSVGVNITPINLQRMLSDIKTGKISVLVASKKFGVPLEYIQALLAYLKENGMMVYSDLITDFQSMVDMSLQLENSPIPSLFNFKVVIVDEFQDMYHELLQMVERIVKYPTKDLNPDQYKHLCIAGDPNQSIYEFLGSQPDLMYHIDERFQKYSITEVELNESFRSTPEILRAATAISIYDNDQQNQLEMISLRPHGFKPTYIEHASVEEEHFFIATEVTRLICESGGLLTPSDFAILTRTHNELEKINKLFNDTFDLNCNRLSSSAVWTKSTVHEFINILMVLKQGRGSNFPLLCMVQHFDPVGSRRISSLFNKLASCEIKSLEEYLMNSEDVDTLYKKHPNILSNIRLFLTSIQQERNSISLKLSTLTPNDILQSLLNICQNCNLLSFLNSQENLPYYLDSFHKSLRFCFESWNDQYKGNDLSSGDQELFLDYFLRCYGDQVPILDRDMINLSTIHAAKGLEFPVVFITGASRMNIFSGPYWESLLKNKHSHVGASSQSRLFYVASTRAKNLLYIGGLKTDSDPKFMPSLCQEEIPNLKSSIINDEVTPKKIYLQVLAKELSRSSPTAKKLTVGKELFTQFSKETIMNNTKRDEIFTVSHKNTMRKTPPFSHFKTKGSVMTPSFPDLRYSKNLRSRKTPYLVTTRHMSSSGVGRCELLSMVGQFKRFMH
ncbi:hypothetical protein CAAN1_03S00870 [[Candida] anglica]|uniref:DNA 3'-5' helicase n=1 Tax=[Candida] anglica TaxID=148631 RepID=A0ABP0EGK1_9ASCO